jgi:hypothetical protein
LLAWIAGLNPTGGTDVCFVFSTVKSKAGQSRQRQKQGKIVKRGKKAIQKRNALKPRNVFPLLNVQL